MRRGGMILSMLLAVACVSKREHRQLAFVAEQTTVSAGRDSMWWARSMESSTVQLLDLEEWFKGVDASSLYTDTGGVNTIATATNTGTLGRMTATMGPNYRRLRLYTLRTDTSTVTAGRSSDTISRYTERSSLHTDGSVRSTASPGRYTWWIVMVCVLAVLVYRLVRRIHP